MTTATLATSQEERSPSSGEISYSNNYIYPEFAGWAGEELLEDILMKILTRSLFRTWRLFAKKQAPGNDCFLSISTLCKKTGLGERAIRQNLQEFQARTLLEMRPGQKLLLQKDGAYKLKWVIIKDFSNLYALAHEYCLWLEAPNHIEPNRELAEVLRQQDEHLVKKLLRFENYRSIILDMIPGRKPQKREPYPLFAEFGLMDDRQSVSSDEETSFTEETVKEVVEEKSCNLLQTNAQTIVQTVEKINSKERKTFDNHTETSKGDSNDSGRSIEEGAAKDYTKDETPKSEQVRETLSPSTPPTKTTNPEPKVSETGGADQAARRDQQKAGGTSSKHKKYQGDGKPRPVANAAISAYVRTFSQRLGDQNMRASETYLLRQAEEYSLSHPLHTLACLVRAHVEALPMQPKVFHPVTKEPLKMPLLNYLFKQFAMSFSVWSQDYLEDGAAKLREDIEKDELLKLFVYEYQDPGAPSEAQEVVQDVSEPQIVFEELRIPSPARWMEEAEAEALVARIEGDRGLLEAEQMTVEFALIHRCRSLVRKEGVFIVEIELTAVNGAGQRDRWPMHLADESQWQDYCEEQKIFPRSKP